MVERRLPEDEQMALMQELPESQYTYPEAHRFQETRDRVRFVSLITSLQLLDVVVFDWLG
jgi:hypothetical protein